MHAMRRPCLRLPDPRGVASRLIDGLFGNYGLPPMPPAHWRLPMNRSVCKSIRVQWSADSPLAAPLCSRRPQMEVLLPMTVRFANPIQCGGSWGFARYHGFFT